MEYGLHRACFVDIISYSSTRQEGLFPRPMVNLLCSPCTSIILVIFIILKKKTKVATLYVSKKYGFLQFF